MSLQEIADPLRNGKRFNSAQKNMAARLENAIKKQGLPEGFKNKDVHIRKEKNGPLVFISNADDQMCGLNDDKLELYIVCPKCKNIGFKNRLTHTFGCDA
jgi:hypothetical protein